MTVVLVETVEQEVTEVGVALVDMVAAAAGSFCFLQWAVSGSAVRLTFLKAGVRPEMSEMPDGLVCPVWLVHTDEPEARALAERRVPVAVVEMVGMAAAAAWVAMVLPEDEEVMAATVLRER